jgi:cell division GTPase FtsZ
MPTPGWINLLT